MNLEEVKTLLNLCDRYEDSYNGYTYVRWAFGNIGVAEIFKTKNFPNDKHANKLVVYSFRDKPGLERTEIAVFGEDVLPELETCGTLIE